MDKNNRVLVFLTVLPMSISMSPLIFHKNYCTFLDSTHPMITELQINMDLYQIQMVAQHSVLSGQSVENGK